MATSATASLTVILAVASLLVGVSAQPVGQLGSWVDARATYYGTDAWSIHTGECGFGYICPQRWTGGPQGLAEGWDVAAISDHSNLDTGSQCGTCLEVKCRDATFTDNYGNSFNRVGMCLNSDSVKVKIVDLCPCNYPNNAYSNKEWCCGDMPHLDMSAWAIEKIVQDHTRWGVFGISYRTIPCDEVLSNPAPQIANPVADPHANLKPAGLDCSTQGPQGVQAYSAAPATRSTTRTVSTPKVHHHTWAYYHNVHHHTPTYYARLKAHKKGRRMLLESSQPDTVALQQPSERIYIHHEESQWTAALNGLAGWTSKQPATNDLRVGKKAVCCTAPTQGSSCGFMGPAGAAEAASMLGFYYQRQSSEEALVSVSIVGAEGVCDGPIIKSVGEVDTTSANEWAYYKVPLSQIIDGCADHSEVSGVAFTNQGSEPASFCIDSLSLL